jgi:hypothetical protein
MRILTSNLLLLFFVGCISVACGQTKTISGNIVPDNIEIADNVALNPVGKKADYFAHLKPEHKEILQDWLKTKKFLRPGVEEIDNSIFQEKYKDHFEDNVKFLRDTVGKNGYQYYSKGDFNRDGKEDFAVLLVDSRKHKETDADFFTLAIFNGPFRKGQAPNYYEEGLSGITNSYIVFDKVSEKHLFLGKFESDVYCATYFPKGKTYRFEDCI